MISISSLWRSFLRLKPPLFVFSTTIIFYSILWIISPSNKIIIASFIIFFLCLYTKLRNIRLSAFLTYFASLIVLTGKTYEIQLIPPGVFSIDLWPNGYLLHIIVTPSHVIAFFLSVIISIDLLKKQFPIIRITLSDWLIFLAFFWRSVASLLASKQPEISIILTLLSSTPLVAYLFLRLYAKQWKAPLLLSTAIIAGLLVFESVISLQQFSKGTPLGKSIEAQKGIEFFGEGADELQFRFRPLGTFEHANELGAFTAFALFVVLALYSSTSKRIFEITFLIGLITLITTLSRSSWIAFSIGLFVSARLIKNLLKTRQIIFSPGKTTAIGAVSFIFFVFFIFPRLERSIYSFVEVDGGGTTRILQIKNALMLISRSPLMGVGAGMNVIEGYIQDPGGVMAVFPTSVHNMYLLLAVEHGIPALVLFLAFVLSYLRTIQTSLRKISLYNQWSIITRGILAGIITLSIVAIFQPIWHEPFIILSLALIYENVHKNQFFSKT